MSGYPYDSDYPSSPRRQLAGAARPSANPRIHAIQKPYSRPNSYAGSSLSHELIPASGNGNGHVSPTKGSSALAPTTRPALPTSQSHGAAQRSFPRSGSESSLFGSLKGLISRPLSWLATPRSTTKRDQSTWNAGLDSEDPESPSIKKLRRHSPPRTRTGGVYDPPSQAAVAKGKGKEREMLPPLPDIAGGLKKLPTSRTAGSDLPHSQSMPYLDPPSDVFSPGKKRTGGGAITRSRGMNLAALANDEEPAPVPASPQQSHHQPQKEVWSPWKQQPAGRGHTPVKRGNRSSISEVRDYALPSLSPFRAPPSPTVSTGLARSATTNNLRRAGSIASDISMGRQSNANRQMKASSSMLFGPGQGAGSASVAGGDVDEAMSVDGGTDNRNTRDGSVLDWFMRDRWSREPGSPRHQRTSSLAPSSSMPPIRKGQLVWNSEKGFVRESELKAAEAPPFQQNQAERILFALESMRKTPLDDARKSTASSSAFPSSLIGSSSRQIRRAINVPLATAQAGETARSKRDKDRLGGDERVSVMISPYGRRRAADSEMREKSVATDDYRHTKSPSHSRSHTDHEMASNKTPTPEPPREPSPEPTPRRSSRLKRHDASAEVEEETPRTKRSTRSKGGVKNAAVETSAPSTKDTGRRRRKATTELMSPEPEAPPPMPSIPTITETAPSPSEKSTSTSTYQPRSADEMPRQQSSLRARTEKTKRAHGASAHGSRATSPTSGGRFSAKEEDLPDMDELEQSKISLPSFAGISFGNFGVPAPAPSPAPAAPAPAKEKTAPTASSGLGVPRASAGPLSRLNASRPRASSPLAGNSIVAQPDSPESTASASAKEKAALKPNENGFFSLSGSSTPAVKPAAQAPLFGSTDASKKPAFNFGLGKPSAPPSSTTPPAAEGGDVPNFFGRKSGEDSGTATPVVAAPTPFSFGSSEPKSTEAPAKKDSAPFSFGSSTSTAPPADKPAPAPIGSFNFGGASSKPSESAPTVADKPASNPFSFGSSSNAKIDKPAPAPIGSFNFGGASANGTSKDVEKKAPAPIGSFNFGGTSKSDDKSATSGTITPSFFGSSKPAEPAKPVEAPKFSFGSTAAAPPAPAATPSAPFSFGSPAADTAKAAPAEPKVPFSFGSTAKPAEPAAAPKAPFSFDSSSAEPAKAPEPAKGGFGFGSPATPAPAETKSTGFSFGQTSTTPAGKPPAASFSFGGAKAAEPAKPTSSPGFGFGGSQDNKANGSAAPSTFGSSAPASTPSTGGFAFGQNGGAAAPAPASTGFGFGNSSTTPSAPAPASNPFGGGQPAQSTGFGFGSGASAPAPSSTPSFGAPASNASPFGGPSQNGPSTGFAFGGSNTSSGFGSAAPAPATNPGFGFGQPAAPTTPTSASTNSFNFGASTTPSQSTFTFGGAPAQNGSTTPGGQPAGAGFRFGSPAPGGTPPVDGSGFSLGADSNPPGSPSGRKIKPLRRGTKRA